jgi:hypothetical protein
MSEELALGAAADPADGPVRQAHNMERIGHNDGVGEVRVEPGPVGLERVDRHHFDPGQPLGGPIAQPGAQDVSGTALDHIHEQTAADIDQSGRPQRRMRRRGRQEGGLVDPNACPHVGTEPGCGRDRPTPPGGRDASSKN